MAKTLEELYKGWIGEIQSTRIEFPPTPVFDFFGVPTWALIEELKKRPGVTFRANTTKEGLVGTFERAPAMVFTVKLPIESEV